jgi:hypothetical protein
MEYTIKLTNLEKLALEYIAFDTEEYITNFSKNRANIAVKEILKINTKHCNENNIAIAVGEEAQVEQAYELKLIKKGSEIESHEDQK